MKPKIRPLTGQVLVEIMPAEKQTAGGLAIPEYDPTPEDHQRMARNPEMPPGVKGRVRAIGAWPKTKSGLAQMPEYGVGAFVVIPPKSGLELHRNLGDRFRMVKQSQVLAVLV